MKKVLLNSILLLCALIVGSGNLWAQSDYSATYTSGTDFTSVITGSNVTIGTTNYVAVKKGTGKAAGSITITVPKDTKYLHLHAAGWNGETVTLSITPNTYSSTKTISLTSDSNISGSGTTYDVDDSKCTSSYYKVITFTSALASNTNLTFSATNGNRFVIWGVNKEVESSDPSSDASFTNTTPSISYPATKTYSQAPTTAAGYTGSISYSMTANTAGASINTSTGVVTVTQGGSVTVKAIAAAVPGSFSGSEASYTLTVNDTRSTLSDEQFAWTAGSANVTYGADNNTFPTLTNTQSVPVTYSSSSQAAATINESTGDITLKDYTGNTTISAIFAGNDDYKAKTVEYTLNVTKAPFAIKDGVFDFVEAAEAGEDYDSGVSTTSSSSEYVTTDKTWIAGNVTMVTSKVSGNGYRWWESDGTLRFYATSSATISVPDDYVITKIVTTGANFDSSSPSGLSGSTWTGASNEVVLTATATRNIKTITVTYTTETQAVTIGSTGWATFCSDYALNFAGSGVSAYIITGHSGSTITKSNTPLENVPANTPLLLNASTSGIYNIPVIASSSTSTSGNLLVRGTGEAVGYVANKTRYVLMAKNSTTAEFQLLADGGASATVGTDKAYLQFNEVINLAPAAFRLTDEESGATNIDAIDATEDSVKFIENGKLFIKKNGVVYDMLGTVVRK